MPIPLPGIRRPYLNRPRPMVRPLSPMEIQALAWDDLNDGSAWE